jgi:hypothetical protein
MKLFKTLILFFLISGTLSLQAVDSTNPFEEVDESWVLLIKKYGKEKFLAKFPSNFEIKYLPIKENQKAVHVFSSEEDVQYFFTVYPNSEKIENKLEVLKKSPHINIVKVLESKNALGKVVDILYTDDSILGDGTTANCKAKIIQTRENIYSFFTIFKDDKKDKHDFFVSSFFIE